MAWSVPFQHEHEMFEVAQQVASAGIIEMLFLMTPFAVTMVLIAVRIWHAPTEPDVDNRELVLSQLAI